MRILFVYYHHSPQWSVIHTSILRAFRNLGHEIITCGRVNKIDPKTHLDIEFNQSQVTIEQILKRIKTKPDLLFFCWPNNHFWILNIEQSPIPTVLYAVDTHIPLIKAWMEGYSLLFDYVFSAQKNLKKALWIPLAYNPSIHKNYHLYRKYDVAFVGNRNFFQNPRRSIYLEILKLLFKAKVANLYFDKMAKLYSRAKIVINISVSDDLNARVFEAMASGALLLTSHRDNCLTNLFEDKKHLVTYSNIFDAIAKINYYLKHLELRELIAQNGERVVRQHSYQDRVKTMLLEIKKRGFGKKQRTLTSKDYLKTAKAFYLLGSKERTTYWLRKASEKTKFLINDIFFKRPIILSVRKIYALKLILWQLMHF